MGKECKYYAHFMITSRAARDIFSVFFSTCHALKTRFELSRVKLFRNDLKGSFIARGSSYRGVRVTEGKITVNVWRKSRGNRF